MKMASPRSKMEIELANARSILVAMSGDIEDIERYWPPSKRGSNAQRALDSLKERHRVAVLCLEDAEKSEG